MFSSPSSLVAPSVQEQDLAPSVPDFLAVSTYTNLTSHLACSIFHFVYHTVAIGTCRITCIRISTMHQHLKQTKENKKITQTYPNTDQKKIIMIIDACAGLVALHLTLA